VRRIGDGGGDDVASEVIVRAFRARGRYRAEHDTALPWLLGIANNVIADHRRLERRRLAALERLTREAPGLIEHRDTRPPCVCKNPIGPSATPQATPTPARERTLARIASVSGR
jgi:RNA polymerase sigma-70 factor (ECF subfamily)